MRIDVVVVVVGAVPRRPPLAGAGYGPLADDEGEGAGRPSPKEGPSLRLGREPDVGAGGVGVDPLPNKLRETRKKGTPTN